MLRPVEMEAGAGEGHAVSYSAIREGGALCGCCEALAPEEEAFGALCAPQGLFCGSACEVLEGTFQLGWEWEPGGLSVDLVGSLIQRPFWSAWAEAERGHRDMDTPACMPGGLVRRMDPNMWRKDHSQVLGAEAGSTGGVQSRQSPGKASSRRGHTPPPLRSHTDSMWHSVSGDYSCLLGLVQ